jgi:hypothetical protein
MGIRVIAVTELDGGMPVTISFRVAERLEDYLEEEAKRQMTTKSAIARQMLTERARQVMEGEEAEGGNNQTGGSSVSRDRSTFNAEELADPTRRRHITEHSGGRKYRVYDDNGTDHRYFDTAEGALNHHDRLYDD